MRVSVVVVTYNWPQALQLVLRALARQSALPFEVIVSDDGSRTDTRDLLAATAQNFPTRLVHLWQPDDGARMSRARNRGIAAARGDYIVFLDGDMLAHREFIADHIAFAQRGCFVQGSRVLTGERCAARLLAEQRLDLGFFAPDIERRRHTLRMPALARAYARPHTREAGIKSCNWGFWRDDLLALNGFNETMTGWGREDDSWGVALKTLAGKPFHLRGRLWHLWHPPQARPDRRGRRRSRRRLPGRHPGRRAGHLRRDAGLCRRDVVAGCCGAGRCSRRVRC